MTPMPIHLLWLIPLLPFAGFLVNGLLGRRLPKAAVSGIALLTTGASAAIVVWLIATFHAEHLLSLVTGHHAWIEVSGFQITFSLAVDHLTLIMLTVVTGVGFLIHVYSAGYLAHEEGYWRFFAYLNLFMFFMLVLVLAANFLLLFVGWEGVGLASYLLIGFYFTKDSAANAGKKAFIVNRIGDFGFLLAMFMLIAHFGSSELRERLCAGQHASADAGRLPDGHRAAADAGRRGQVRSDSALRLAAGRDGRPDARFRAHPRGHDGHRRHLYGRALPCDL